MSKSPKTSTPSPNVRVAHRICSSRLSWVEPNLPKAVLQPAEPMSPSKDNAHLLSKFVFLDETVGQEYVEYIEPLMSHLRFALAKCLPTKTTEQKNQFTTFRGWIIPPPPNIRRNRALYFDVGSASWNSILAGGAALKFFSSVWSRQSINFDEIYAFDATTPVPKFYRELPSDIGANVHYQKCAVGGVLGDNKHPFVPNLIHRVVLPDDYVLFKLDIDSPTLEKEIIEFILQDPDSQITELVWEHHISGNYLMEEWGKPESLDQASLRDSYNYFLRLRLKGIRAHSWV